jgi:hypothetical protein
VPVSGPVESYDPILLRGHLDKATRFKILDHASVAVQQHEGLALTSLDVMKADAIDLEEAPFRRMLSLGLLCEVPIYQGGT